MFQSLQVTWSSICFFGTKKRSTYHHSSQIAENCFNNLMQFLCLRCRPYFLFFQCLKRWQERSQLYTNQNHLSLNKQPSQNHPPFLYDWIFLLHHTSNLVIILGATPIASFKSNILHETVKGWVGRVDIGVNMVSITHINEKLFLSIQFFTVNKRKWEHLQK